MRVCPTCSLPLQASMPQTLSAFNMVTPGNPSPPCTKPMDDEQGKQPILDGAPSSASLYTLMQYLVPTANYYPKKAYIFTFLLSSHLFIEPRSSWPGSATCILSSSSRTSQCWTRTKPPASIHRELLSICSDPYMLAQQLTHVELVSRPMPSSA
uniref:RasGEF domain family member 1C n=1 Tax=Molossus molossus TaxID=27622 RepID=A0A7J8IBZ6_MOLMO|nr:RasGEF domain family member 1C [Molossus molossus]